MRSPYRLPPVTDLTLATPSALLYPAVVEAPRTRIARAGASVWLGAIVLTPIIAVAGHPEVAGLAIALLVGRAVVWVRRTAKVSGVLLAVKDDVLTLTDGDRPLLTVPLAELEDVGLDSKSIRKVELGQDAVPVLRFINTQVGPEIDVARIALSIEGRDEPFLLTSAFLPHMDAVEWAGKIRSFLRKHRWVPEDERAEDDDQT